MLQLVEILSRPPASLKWTEEFNGSRMGSCPGFLVSLREDKSEAIGVFAPDSPGMSARNAFLMELFLCCMRPDWADSAEWLLGCMRDASKFTPGEESPAFTVENPEQGARFVWLKPRSQAALVLSGVQHAG